MNIVAFPGDQMPPTTESIGYFRLDVASLADWVVEVMSKGGATWTQRTEKVSDLGETLRSLLPLADIGVSRYLLFPVGDWTAMLNNAKLGTDVGLFPASVALDLGSCAIRADSAPETHESYGANILEFYEPEADDQLRCRRVVSAANDGGRWRFDQFGAPFAFEETDVYFEKRIRDRFTKQMLHRYLVELGVPPFTSQDLVGVSAVWVEREPDPKLVSLSKKFRS